MSSIIETISRIKSSILSKDKYFPCKQTKSEVANNEVIIRLKEKTEKIKKMNQKKVELKLDGTASFKISHFVITNCIFKLKDLSEDELEYIDHSSSNFEVILVILRAFQKDEVVQFDKDNRLKIELTNDKDSLQINKIVEKFFPEDFASIKESVEFIKRFEKESGNAQGINNQLQGEQPNLLANNRAVYDNYQFNRGNAGYNY